MNDRISINWFLVLLPTTNFTIYKSLIPPDADIPRTFKTVESMTYVGNYFENKFLFFLTDNPGDVDSSQIDLVHIPQLGGQIISFGYSQKLNQAGFDIKYGKVDVLAQKQAPGSVRPDIFDFYSGLKFHAYFFRDGDSYKWGLVINYLVSQRFNITLADPGLRTIGIGRQVVVAAGAKMDEEIKGRWFLVESKNNQSLVRGGDGETKTIDSSALTLPCTMQNLQAYITVSENREAVSKVTQNLLVTSLSLTPKGRINTFIAKDQLERVQEIIRGHDLTTFQLPLPDNPTVKLELTPLAIERR